MAQETVADEALLQELAVGLRDIFTMSWADIRGADRAAYLRALLRPNKRAQETLMTQREVACIVAPYTDIEVRAVDAVRSLIAEHEGRVDPRICVLVHSDPRGNERLRDWGDERNLAVIPIYRSKRSGLPDPDGLLRTFSTDLYRHDPFARAEPVASDRDFFGRRGDVEGLLRALSRGQVRSIFALRRAGKTSIINRVRALARDAGEASIAMVDASDDAVYARDAAGARDLLARTVRTARREGYAVAGRVARLSSSEPADLLTEFTQPAAQPLIVVIDEVDFIGPYSQANPVWRDQFIPFWRSVRVAYQEARREERNVGIVVCGVSSRAFREVTLDGAENPVFGFVPEEYLKPFSDKQTSVMMKALGQRCGLRFDESACEALHQACGGFPYWLRLAGSSLHEAFELESRPVQLGASAIAAPLEQFVSGEGSDQAERTLANLGDRDPDVLVAVKAIAEGRASDERAARLAMSYGLAEVAHGTRSVCGALIRAAARASHIPPSGTEATAVSAGTDDANQIVVAEITVLHDRLERDLRSLIRATLQAVPDVPWRDAVLKSLPAKRRAQLEGTGGSQLMTNLYFLELKQIVLKNWDCFARRFGDRRRFEAAMDTANARPFAHPKDYDLADLALFRREYRWLQERVDA